MINIVRERNIFMVEKGRKILGKSFLAQELGNYYQRRKIIKKLLMNIF